MVIDLYKQYIKEREGKDIVSDDNGFATYKVNPLCNSSIYVIDVYVVPEKRQKRIASTYLNKIVDKTDCNFLVTSCDESANKWEDSEKAIVGYGFKFRKKEGTLRWYVKEIK